VAAPFRSPRSGQSGALKNEVAKLTATLLTKLDDKAASDADRLTAARSLLGLHEANADGLLAVIKTATGFNPLVKTAAGTLFLANASPPSSANSSSRSARRATQTSARLSAPSSPSFLLKRRARRLKSCSSARSGRSPCSTA